MTVAEQFARTLRATREMRGLTQAELGARAGMAAASVSHFETGVRAPSLESLVRLADALEIPVDSLLGRAPALTGEGDPVFLRAARADTRTLETIRRVTEALLDNSRSTP
jgi:transcriptional regulator with XRE-family HTH domain